jgi:hypothetical protein
MMDRWTRSLLSLSLFTVLLLVACQPKPQTFLPVTGGKDVSLALPAELTRDLVLDYVLSSSRLVSLPPATDWQLDAAAASENEYRFRSGDWLMLVRLPDARHPNRQVLLLNQVEPASWTGYVTPDGHVVDTAYGR